MSMRGADPTSNARRRALTRLLDAHGERLYATLVKLTLRRDVAAELLQELFVRLAGSEIENAGDPAAYAWRAAMNLAMEWRRRRRNDAAGIDVDVVSHEPSPLQRLVQAEQLQRLLDVLDSLSELSREVFVLHYIEQQSYRLVAARVGKTPHQARGICHAAVRLLREKLVKAEQHDGTK
jgi:RNA polymerase sigma-70 factor (ECF subfamily)